MIRQTFHFQKIDNPKNRVYNNHVIILQRYYRDITGILHGYYKIDTTDCSINCSSLELLFKIVILSEIFYNETIFASRCMMKTIQTQGILSAFGAYLLWGLLPIYWKLLKQASALEIFSHRVLWSLLFLLIIVGITRRTTLFRQETLNVLDQPRKILGILITAALISFNWLVYIWAVNDNRIVETSLGYYINPLVNVLIGVLLLKEKLSHRQYFAVLLAVGGVLNLVLHFGKVPWVALSLAVSFALYGLCKKLLGLGATTGIILETTLLAPLTLAYLIWIHFSGASVFGSAMPFETSLLIGAGIVTALPMVLFANAANKLPLSILGFIQYLSPTIALLTGVFLYHEPFTQTHAVSFGLIWLALAIFSWR